MNSLRSTLAWSLFLATSWTWCIGMFLPVLLVRDFGLLGWILFATPNVFGAIAFSFFIKSKAHSLAWTATHSLACHAFSLVTICFQAYFIGWLLSRFGSWHFFFFVILLGLLAGLLRAGLSYLKIAAASWLVSFVCLLLFLFWQPTNGLIEHSLPVAAPSFVSLLALGFASFLAFLLCPYLDLTFHRARQALTEKQALPTFALAFGVFFLILILFPLIYGPALRVWFHEGPFAHPDQVFLVKAKWVLSLHLMTQCLVTILFHRREILPRFAKKDVLLRGSRFLVLLCFFLPYLLTDDIWRGLSFKEIPYRCFLLFYSLIVPAYVWKLCRRSTPNAKSWRFLSLICLLSLPFFALAGLFTANAGTLFIPGILILTFFTPSK